MRFAFHSQRIDSYAFLSMHPLGALLRLPSCRQNARLPFLCLRLLNLVLPPFGLPHAFDTTCNMVAGGMLVFSYLSGLALSV